MRATGRSDAARAAVAAKRRLLVLARLRAVETARQRQGRAATRLEDARRARDDTGRS